MLFVTCLTFSGKISFAELIESEKRLQNGKKKASSGIA
jgi:hypothetical protein